VEKYVRLASRLEMPDAVLISPEQIFFDERAVLKCRWGCENFTQENIRCGSRGIALQEAIEMIRKYENILLIHSHNAKSLSKAVLEIERAAFLDGHYFAFALRACNLCDVCKATQGKPCLTPNKIRPCEQAFGVDVYKTVRGLGLPCEVLQNKTDMQNRYGFVLIN